MRLFNIYRPTVNILREFISMELQWNQVPALTTNSRHVIQLQKGLLDSTTLPPFNLLSKARHIFAFSTETYLPISHPVFTQLRAQYPGSLYVIDVGVIMAINICVRHHILMVM